MKALLQMFSGSISRRAIQTHSILRMQALETLRVILTHVLQDDVTITQADVGLGELEEERGHPKRTAFIEAFFFAHGQKTEFGSEGVRVPVPPKVICEMPFLCDVGIMHIWRPGVIKCWLDNRGSEQWVFEVDGNDSVLKDFTKLFNTHRPGGRASLATPDDITVWDLQIPVQW